MSVCCSFCKFSDIVHLDLSLVYCNIQNCPVPFDSVCGHFVDCISGEFPHNTEVTEL